MDDVVNVFWQTENYHTVGEHMPTRNQGCVFHSSFEAVWRPAKLQKYNIHCQRAACSGVNVIRHDLEWLRIVETVSTTRMFQCETKDVHEPGKTQQQQQRNGI